MEPRLHGQAYDQQGADLANWMRAVWGCQDATFKRGRASHRSATASRLLWSQKDKQSNGDITPFAAASPLGNFAISVCGNLSPEAIGAELIDSSPSWPR